MTRPTLPALRRTALVSALLALSAGIGGGPASAASIVNNAPDTDGVLLADGDDLTNNSTISNGAVASAAVRSTTGNVVSITNNGGGSITGVGQSAILIGDSGDPSFPNARNLGTFTNGGTITAGSTSFDAALDVGGNVGTFTNNSLMQASNYNAIYIHGNMTGTFTNNGTISTGADQTVRVQGTTGTFLNNGSITNSDGAAGLFVGAVTSFTNNDTMQGSGLGVRFQGGVTNFANNAAITATGTAATDTAVNIQGAGTSTVVNTGTIKGGSGLIYALTAGATTLTNSGTIEGTAGAAVTFGDGADDHLIVETTSSIIGTVDARGGTDTLTLGGATGTGSFDAGNIGATSQYRNFEAFTKTGGSSWTLTGTNAAINEWDVDNGTLAVNGTLTNALIKLTGTGILAGTGGTVGDIDAASGTGVSPGAAGIGTLNAADVTFHAGSTYVVDISNGVADRLAASGQVTIESGAHLTINNAGTVCGTSDVTLLSAGSFFDNTTFDLADPNLTYFFTPGSARLTYHLTGGTGRTFSGFTNTANQESTAVALDALGCGNQPYSTAINALTDAQVPGAMDALSGEEHAAIAANFVETSHYLSDTIDARIEQAFAALDGRGTVTAFAPGPMLLESFANATVWASGYGGFAAQASDGNAAGFNSAASGLIVGADGKVTEDWRMGLIAGLGLTGISSGSTTGSSVDASAGGYAGAELGVVTVKMGAAYTRHFVDTRRSIVFPGVSDVVTASYQAGTAQAFFEASADFDVQGVTVSPFARLLAVSHATDAFTETGGAGGALATAPSVSNALFVTLGVAAEDKFALTDTMLVTARGSLGWQHAFADTPTVSNSFVGGGPFTVSSVPVASDVAVLSGGLVLDISDAMNLAVNYDGMLGSGFASSRVSATLAGKF